MFLRHLWKISKKKAKHVDTVVNSIQPLNFPVSKTLSDLHNNLIPPVDCYRTNLSTSSREDQDVVYDEIKFFVTVQHLIPRIKFFQGSKSGIGVNFSPGDLKAP